MTFDESVQFGKDMQKLTDLAYSLFGTNVHEGFSQRECPCCDKRINETTIIIRIIE